VEPAATFGSLSAGEVVLEGPLLHLKLRYLPFASIWDAYDDYHFETSDVGLDFHYLDDDTEPPSDKPFHALALTSLDHDDGQPWRVVYFLILTGVEGDGLTMQRMGLGVKSTDREWARELLDAPVTRLRIV